MTIYYIKQDNTVWCCEEDSGKYYEDIEVSFVKCECSRIEPRTMEEHLQNHKGGGRVLKWRKAKENEISAWYASGDDFFEEGIEFEQQRIIKLLEDPKSHSIEFESITLQAGMEPNWIKKHSDYCPGCIAIALIKGKN